MKNIVNRNHFINQYRTSDERRVRYCYLTTCCGLNRDATRAIVGRSDVNIVKSLDALEKSGVKLQVKTE